MYTNSRNYGAVVDVLLLCENTINDSLNFFQDYLIDLRLKIAVFGGKRWFIKCRYSVRFGHI